MKDLLKKLNEYYLNKKLIEIYDVNDDDLKLSYDSIRTIEGDNAFQLIDETIGKEFEMDEYYNTYFDDNEMISFNYDVELNIIIIKINIHTADLIKYAKEDFKNY